MSGNLRTVFGRAALCGGTSLVALLASHQPAAAQCVTLPGLIECNPTPAQPVVLVNAALPVDVTLPDAFSNLVIVTSPAAPITVEAVGASALTSTDISALLLVSPNNSVTVDVGSVSTTINGPSLSPAGVNIVAGTNALVSLDSVTTLGAASDGISIVADTIDLDVGAVATNGVDADGVVLVAPLGPPSAPVASVNLDAGTITTLGAASDGINITAGNGVAGAIDVDVDAVSTAGEASSGIVLATPLGPVALDAGVVTTLGEDSSAVTVTAGGDINVEADILRTAADRSLGLDLSTAACLDIGAGARCDITATVGEITTGTSGIGVDSIGALVNATGDVTLDIGTLATDGDRAVGISVTTEPTVCAQFAATGGCETDITVGELTTDGDRATGVLIAAAGPTNVAIGTLGTLGPDAPGVDITVDPQACLVLGIGQCGTQLTADEITTVREDSAGVLITSPASITADLGTVETFGANAPAVGITGDPTICLVLGAGGCDATATTVTADRLATAGDGSAGLLVVSPVDVVADLGSVETLGVDAPAVSIAGDPEACVLLGTGACDTSLTADSIRTAGNRSAGVLIASPANVFADLGSVQTLGLDAPAVSITGDPEACVLLGAGACDTTLVADNVTTTGSGSLGVLVNTPARIVADIDSVSTDGNNAAGVTVITEPTLCLLIGPGACGVVVGGGSGGTPGGTPGAPGTPTGPGGSAGGTPGTPGGTNVDTDGNNSPGIVVVTPGPVDVDAGSVTTDGNNSPAIVVAGGEGDIDVDFDVIDTDGINSPGVDVTGTGLINVGGGTVQTDGANSPGVRVLGDDEAVRVDVGAIVTTGPDSDGIDIGTTTGSITVLAGPVTVSGPRSNGIDVNAAGCAPVNVTARDNISSASGIGIDASSACTVSVTTLAPTPADPDGAAVSGAVAGINVVSGTGATIDIGAALSSSGGPALNVDGAAATVLIRPTGVVNGRFDLTNSNDTLTNDGTINNTAASSLGAGNDTLTNNGTLNANANIDFGAGADVLNNTAAGRINVRNGPVAFAGLETTNNAGLIDMRDGDTNDQLTLPGNYVGTGGAALGVDVAPGVALADRLVIGGAATGSTQVLANGLNGGFVDTALVVDAGAGTSATAFGFTPVTVGLVDYSLVFLPGGNDFAIFGTPNISAVGLTQLAEGARQVFYRGNEAVAAHLGSGFPIMGAETTDEQPPISRAFWFNGFGMVQDRDRTLNATPFGQARSFDLDTRQDWYGFQAGVDLIGGPNFVFGPTAGYTGSNLKFEAAPLRIEYEAANVGAYGRFNLGGFNVSGLVKYEHYWIDATNRVLGLVGDADGDGWGGYLEVGYRFGGPNFFVEPLASIEYANLDLDNFTTQGIDFGFDEAEGLRGKAGLRFGAVLNDSPSMVVGYGKVQVIHEFEGEDDLTLTDSRSGLALDFENDGIDTYGRATLGVDIGMGSGVRGFIEGSVDFEGDVSGGGGRAGLSIPF